MTSTYIYSRLFYTFFKVIYIKVFTENQQGFEKT